MFIFRPVQRWVFSGNSAFIYGGTGTSTWNTILRYTGSSISTDSATLAFSDLFYAACAFSGVNLIFGGEASGSGRNTIQRYNGSTRTTDSAVLGQNSRANSALTMSGNAYLFTPNIQRYDGTTVSFPGQALTNATGNAAALIGANAFIVGAGQSSIRRYNTTSLTTDGATLAASNTYPSAVTLSSNMFIFAGEVPAWTSAIQKYDGSTRTTESATLAGNTARTSAAVLDSSAFIFGGSSGAATLIQKFDGTTRTTESSIMPNSGYNGTAAATIQTGASPV